MGRKGIGVDAPVNHRGSGLADRRVAAIMFIWLKDWCKRQRLVCADADELMRLFGAGAYEEACKRGREPGHRNSYWNYVRREIGQREFAMAAQMTSASV